MTSQSPKLEGLPVMALTLINCGDCPPNAGELLVVARRPETNVSHPNVICVPTQRFPVPVAQTLVSGASAKRVGEVFHFAARTVSNLVAHDDDPLIYAVDAILARKMGVADALERRTIRYQAKLGSLAIGLSEVSITFGDGVVANTVSMLNVAVRVVEGADLFPRESSSYSRIFWVGVKTFLEAAKSRIVTTLCNDLSVFDFCIHGLCVATTCEILANSGLHTMALGDQTEESRPHGCR
jgi:hypothetical protein